MECNFKRANNSAVIAMLCALSFLLAKPAFSQKAYFVDGYHGGVWGHYPDWNTRFIVDNMKAHPQWKINLEIEPETWDHARKIDPSAYKEFKDLLADQSSGGRIEYINPAYAQSYFFNVSGESIIRQFQYGMKKLNEHFPGIVFTTYSSEEPCFTSALPQILKSLGFKYASLKNPNTCWGGYTRAFGGEAVNWTGPDGTKITTVPRYATESLKPNSTWETIASRNSREFVQAALNYGISHPVGMCLQDAGWRNGPWLGKNGGDYHPTEYTTWRNYFENIAETGHCPEWRFTQEDVQVSLVWGAQVLQRIAQKVRVSENKILKSEKLAAMAAFFKNMDYPQRAIDSAWRTLMLAEHHDCWIVPYNGRPGDTWADKVTRWTASSDRTSDSIMHASALSMLSGSLKAGPLYVRVFNTCQGSRSEMVSVPVPEKLNAGNISILDAEKRPVAAQVTVNPVTKAREVVFRANVPSFGYNTYRMEPGKAISAQSESQAAILLKDGTYKVETDLYRMIIDPLKGGTIKSLIAKKLQNREFVNSDSIVFNELRGYFYNAGGYHSGADNPARVTIMENGPARVKIKIEGMIAGTSFTQTIRLEQGQPRIDLRVKIDWKGNPGIGAYSEAGSYDERNPKKAFYNDRYKLLTLFPLNLKGQKVFKNAPYDVTESRLQNTFFSSWDSIKNNIILNWIDITDSADKYGMAIFSDHTTSYTHGTNFPAGLTIQYSGLGLWGMDYTVDGPTEVRYALVPHKGRWNEAGIWEQNAYWNEPLSAVVTERGDERAAPSHSMLSVKGRGVQVTSVTDSGKDLLVRIFNADTSDKPCTLLFNGKADGACFEELNGRLREKLRVKQQGSAGTAVEVFLPAFGIRTVKISGYSK